MTEDGRKGSMRKGKGRESKEGIKEEAKGGKRGRRLRNERGREGGR